MEEKDNTKILYEDGVLYVYFCKNGKIVKIEDVDGYNDKIILEEMNCKAGSFLVDNQYNIVLLITQLCNLKCTYCYGEEGEYHDEGMMEWETAKQFLDTVITKSNGEYSIHFFGGEPLLNFYVIKEIVNYCEKKFAGISVSYCITTNGVLINEEIATFLHKNKFKILLSLDGDASTNDLHRKTKNNDGTYNTILKNTEMLRSMGVVDVRATLTPNNMDIVKIFKHLSLLGFRRIIIEPAYNMFCKKDYQELISKQNCFLRYWEEEVRNKNYITALKCTTIMNIMYRIYFYTIRENVCSAGKNGIAVDIHGNLYPCHRFVEKKDYASLNLNEFEYQSKGFLKEIQQSKSYKCKICWLHNLCMSGCPYNNLNVMGKLGSVGEDYCNLMQIMYENILRAFLRLKQSDKKILFSIKTEE